MNRNTFQNFYSLLANGIRFDWQYSLVTTLVISGLICTPLILGSIRAGAYRVHIQEAATTHNAKQIKVESRASRVTYPLDEGTVAKVKEHFPAIQSVGDWDLRIRIVGPEGRYADNARAIWQGDPRIDVFRIETATEDLDLKEVVLSDIGGTKLFGSGWADMWSEDGTFSGGKVKLEYDRKDLGEFKVVGRTGYRTRDVFVSPQLAGELRRYSDGEGSAVLNLPSNEIGAAGLPKLSTASCALMVEHGPECGATEFDRFLILTGESDHEVNKVGMHGPLPEVGYSQAVVEFRERVLEVGAPAEPANAICMEALKPKAANSCPSVFYSPIVSAEALIAMDKGATDGTTIELISMSPALEQAHVKAGIFTDRDGDPVTLSEDSLVKKGAMDAILSSSLASKLNATVGARVFMKIDDLDVPVTLRAIYPCDAECPEVYADPQSVFRIANLRDKLIEVVSDDPLAFRNVRTSRQFDQVLVYAENVMAVQETTRLLKNLLGDDGYTIDFNRRTLKNIERDDTRLATVFKATLIFAIIFLFLALGALSRINVDRRRRQIAQLIILGFSYWFVRILVVVEYLILALAAVVFSLFISLGLSWGLRTILLSGAFGGASGAGASVDRSFERVVNAMTVDAGVFFFIVALVLGCAFLVSVIVAWVLSRADPLELLE